MVQCKKCKLFLSLSKDDVLKCKGACEGTYHKKCVRNVKQFTQNEACDTCMGSPKAKSSKIEIDPGKTTVEAILGEVNNKLEIIFSMEKKLEELAANVDFYAEKYQQMMEFKETAERKINSLEQKNIYLDKCNKALEERIMIIEQQSKEKMLKSHASKCKITKT